MKSINKGGLVVVMFGLLIGLSVGVAIAADEPAAASAPISEKDKEIVKESMETTMMVMGYPVTVSFRDVDGNAGLDLFAEYTGKSTTDDSRRMARAALEGAITSTPIKDRLDRVYLRFGGSDIYAQLKDLIVCDGVKGKDENSACWDKAWHKVK